MSNTISGGISFGGIGSGMDMNAIVGQLKKVQEIPVNRLTLTKAENEYRINALEAVLKQMRESNSILKKFNTPGKMLSLNIESSNEGVASATIVGNADLTESSYKIDVKQLAKSSIYTLEKTFDKKDSVITTKDGKFSYTYKGEKREIDVPANTTLEQFVKRLNNDSLNPGVKASIVKNGSGYVLQVQGKDTGKESELFISSDLDGFSSSGGSALFTGKETVISTSQQSFAYEYNGKKYSFDVKAGMTAEQFVEEFNKDTKQDAVQAKLVREGSDYKIKFFDKSSDTELTNKELTNMSGPDILTKGTTLSGKNSVVSTSATTFTAQFAGGKNVSVNVSANMTLDKFVEEFNKNNQGIKAELVGNGSGYTVQYKDDKGEVIKPEQANGIPSLSVTAGSKDNWHVQHAQDAIFKLGGQNREFTSDTNKLTEVVEGMEITLKSEGETVLTVASDRSKLKENIHEVVDAINLIKKTVLELSKVDEKKETTKPEDGEMSSQLTWQKGSALTGNYGIQLFLSDFNKVTTSMGGGFRKKSDVNDIFGDAFTVLSEIGIKTNAKSGDPNFGLLEIDEEALDKALADDPDAVMELLSSPLGGTTPSNEFTVASAGLHARPGTYEVTYDVDAKGHATNVKINGVLAQTDPQYPGRWTVGDPKNPAVGVAIQFPTSGGMKPGTGNKSEIRIRQGKINEMASFIDRELVQSDVAGVEQGKIPTIISGFKKTIENVEAKIKLETERIAQWERRERLKFSRLEETLTKYNQQMGSIASIAGGMMAGAK